MLCYIKLYEVRHPPVQMDKRNRVEFHTPIYQITTMASNSEPKNTLSRFLMQCGHLQWYSSLKICGIGRHSQNVPSLKISHYEMKCVAMIIQHKENIFESRSKGAGPQK